MSSNNLGLHAKPKTRPESCDLHGPFESKCYIGSIWSRCPTCATQAADKEQAEAESRARESRLAAWQNKIGQSGIPERFHTRSFENFVATDAAQTKALDFCKRYADQFDEVIATGRSAIFIGKPGTGKTHLAAAIGLQVMRKQNRAVLFTTVMRAIRRVKDSWDRGSSESESQVIQTFVAADLLILDEVGVQFGTEFEKNILFDVINERYEKRKPTILMSNLPVSDVTAYLGERVIDRIREDGGARIVFDWSSHRAKMQGGL